MEDMTAEVVLPYHGGQYLPKPSSPERLGPETHINTEKLGELVCNQHFLLYRRMMVDKEE